MKERACTPTHKSRAWSQENEKQLEDKLREQQQVLLREMEDRRKAREDELRAKAERDRQVSSCPVLQE